MTIETYGRLVRWVFGAAGPAVALATVVLSAMYPTNLTVMVAVYATCVVFTAAYLLAFLLPWRRLHRDVAVHRTATEATLAAARIAGEAVAQVQTAVSEQGGDSAAAYAAAIRADSLAVDAQFADIVAGDATRDHAHFADQRLAAYAAALRPPWWMAGRRAARTNNRRPDRASGKPF